MPETTIAGAILAAITAAMEADPKVIVLGEDIADHTGGGVWKTFKGLSSKFGEDRVRHTPISEQAIIGAATGAAIGGYRPIADIMFFDFSMVCMDQIANHAAKVRYMSGGATTAPITITTTVGSGRFGAQHVQSLEGWFMHTPGIKVVMPSTPADAFGLMTACIQDDDPCLFIQHSALLYSVKGEVPERCTVPLGKATVVREGSDITLVAYGRLVSECLAAANDLAARGVSAEVIDLRSLVPLDIGTVLASVEKTRRALVAHDATEFCGPGAEIASLINEDLFADLLSPVRRLGSDYIPSPFASELETRPTQARVVAGVLSLIEA